VKANDQLFTRDAIELLQSHTWPGNVRELANVIEHATILCDEAPITGDDLPQRFNARGVASIKMSSRAMSGLSLREIEMRAINESLERHQGNKPEVAEELGISLKTLYNKLNQQIALDKAA
jgi:two-component system NtrC family response regulator